MMGKNDAACKKMPGGIRGRSLCISRGQTRCANYRNRDNDRSPARYRAARIRNDGKIIPHRFGQRFQNSPLRSGNNPNLAGGGTGIRRRATAAGGRGTGGGTPNPFKSLYDTIRTMTNRVESEKVRYDVIELDNLRLQKKGFWVHPV